MHDCTLDTKTASWSVEEKLSSLKIYNETLFVASSPDELFSSSSYNGDTELLSSAFRHE
jgi:hypothetical protein